jgi:hypothetical protein
MRVKGEQEAGSIARLGVMRVTGEQEARGVEGAGRGTPAD